MKKYQEVKYIPESKSWYIDGLIIAEEKLSAIEINELQEAAIGNLTVLHGNESVRPKNSQII